MFPSVPRIDPNVRHVSLGQLRKEATFDKTLVVTPTVGAEPVAVVVPYATFIEMQKAIEESDRGAIA